jgi:hypothetical protein
VQDAKALRRGVYRPLASNLAGCAKRVIIGDCFRWPKAFARLALNSRRRIRDGVVVEFRDKEEMDLDQHGSPDHQLSQEFKPLASHLRKKLTSSRLFIFPC